MISATFRFNAESHTYVNPSTKEVYPHITGMMKADGLIDDRWYTEESCDRGKAVHTLTADFDLGALDVRSCVSPFRGYLLGHVKAMAIVRPEVSHVEEPAVHRIHRFGGRIDRVGKYYKRESVLEVKSGGEEDCHRIQTALQAILAADEVELPPHAIARFALYLGEDGRFKLREHVNRKDFDKAFQLIRRYCR